MTTWRDYVFSYRFEGAEYGFTIRATSEEESKRRLSAMGLARYDGELIVSIPVPGGNLLAKLIRWFR